MPTEDIVRDAVTKRETGDAGDRICGGDGGGSGERAGEACERKGVDGMVVNDVSQAETGFDSDWNAGTFLTREGGAVAMPLGRKTEMAERILDEVAGLRERMLRPAEA